jgi:hypothetical protein
VRKAYAGFTGQPYVIKPIYQTNKPNTNKTEKNKEDQSKNKTITQKGGSCKINKTRKHNLFTSTSNRRKTIKNI